MNLNRNHFAIALGVLFVLAAGYIIYTGRPVMKLPEQQVVTTTSLVVESNVVTTSASVAATEPTTTSTASAPVEKPVTTSTAAPAPTKPKGVYSMADVEAHATVADCWTTINGGVYDLTTWVGRHPGGENPIAKLCGKDGGANFNRKHGSTKNAQATLILLKIGTLE